MSSAGLNLPTAYRDVCAADLRLSLGLPTQEALLTRAVAGPGWTAELRILGASHQVLLAGAGRDLCSETVACAGPRRPDDRLPSRHTTTLDGARYRFRSATSRLQPAALRATVAQLLAALTADPAAACGVFPGDTSAMTAVQARLRSPRVASWRTWHAYPQTGELVLTCTRVERREPTSPGVSP
jgi:hypothetical protein